MKPGTRHSGAATLGCLSSATKSNPRSQEWLRHLALTLGIALAAFILAPIAAAQRVQPGESDQTLRAMRDELQRSRDRLHTDNSPGPFFLQYRLLDVDVRTVVAQFGAVVSTSTSRNRLMRVEARTGDYKLDSSNFVTDDPFQGFLGSTGTVGIDRDYDSLRQDLWLATDQAYKEALTGLSSKQAFLRSLAKPPNIDDFSRLPSGAKPTVLITPRLEPDWGGRNWEEEAKSVSAVLRQYPDLQSSRVTFFFVYTNYYVMNTEGTEMRVGRSLAAMEASLETQAVDGMPLHDFYAAYAATPSGLPAAAALRRGLENTAQELAALRAAPMMGDDYTGPVLFDAPAAGELLAQVVGSSLSGARPPLSMLPMYEQILERMGARSEWSGRAGTRVLPASVSLVDDPTAKEFKGQRLLGGYDVDDEAVPAQRVSIVENGMLRDLLMSRRPGPDFEVTNGHARAALLNDPRPGISNLFFTSNAPDEPAALRKKFMAACKDAGRTWCLEVRRMDNPVLGIHHQEDLSDLIGGIAAGASTGDRLPLVFYRVYVADGKQELVRGGRLTGLTLRAMRNLAGIGDDLTAANIMLNQTPGFAGTALAAFGSAQGGLPASIVAPSLLFEEVEFRGARGEARRTPLLPAPPLN